MSNPKIYKLQFTDTAIKNLNKLDKKIKFQIYKKIESLKIPSGAHNIKKLKGYETKYRLRSGDYRIVYDVYEDKSVVLISLIANRKDIYDLLPGK